MPATRSVGSDLVLCVVTVDRVLELHVPKRDWLVWRETDLRNRRVRCQDW